MIVYCAHCLVTGKKYVGYTSRSLVNRMKSHFRGARKGDPRHFYNAIRKYGETAFVWGVIEEMGEVNHSEAKEREKHWIDTYNTYVEGYNSTEGGDGRVGACSESHKENLRIALRKYYEENPEELDRLSRQSSGRVQSLEEREAKSKKLKNRKRDKEVIERIVNTRRKNGWVVTDEHAQKIQDANIKYYQENPEARKRCGDSTRGKRCITNGVKNRYILPHDPLPEGWEYGMRPRKVQ